MGRSARVVARLTSPTLLICVLLLVCPAWAHDAAPSRPPQVALSLQGLPSSPSPAPAPQAIASAHGSPEAVGPWSLLLLTSIAILAARTRPRRLVAGVLVVVLVVFSVETAVHSVHHLGAREEASRCEVASIAGHLSAVPAEAVVCDLTLSAVGSAPPAEPPVPAQRLPYSPNRGRAPPARSAT